jgi:hypothetical protein
VAFAVEGDGVGFATESYAASALYTTLASLSGALWRIRWAKHHARPIRGTSVHSKTHNAIPSDMPARNLSRRARAESSQRSNARLNACCLARGSSEPLMPRRRRSRATGPSSRPWSWAGCGWTPGQPGLVAAVVLLAMKCCRTSAGLHSADNRLISYLVAKLSERPCSRNRSRRAPRSLSF